jgi:hypothetical protein
LKELEKKKKKVSTLDTFEFGDPIEYILNSKVEFFNPKNGRETIKKARKFQLLIILLVNMDVVHLVDG